MSFDKTKADPALGQKVHEYLVSVGENSIHYSLSRKEKIQRSRSNF